MERGGDPCGRPAGGSALSALIAVRLRCGIGTLAVALTMPHISAKPHRERMARAELGRPLCYAQWLNTWTCENGLPRCGSLLGGRPGGCNVSVRETTYPDECVKTRYRAHRVLFHMFEKTLDLSFVRPMLSWLNPCKHTGTPPPSFT